MVDQPTKTGIAVAAADRVVALLLCSPEISVLLEVLTSAVATGLEVTLVEEVVAGGALSCEGKLSIWAVVA